MADNFMAEGVPKQDTPMPNKVKNIESYQNGLFEAHSFATIATNDTLASHEQSS